MKTKSLLLVLLLAGPAHAGVDPFYEDLLRKGVHAYDRKEYAAAARDLRVACFGMLDEPARLADCLVRLALAQDRAESLEDFRETFRRIVELEERFGSYTRGGLPADLRTAFEARLQARIPAATLLGTTAFRGLVKPGEKTAAAPTGSRGASPASPERALPAAPPPAPVQAQVQPAQPRPLSEAERQKMEQVRKILAAPSAGNRELKAAFQGAREVADAHPDAAEAQHLAAEAAYRLSRWNDAAAYFRKGGDPGEDKPELLFYMAVSLFESGDPAGAAAALRRSLPNLRKTEYIESYEKKILNP